MNTYFNLVSILYSIESGTISTVFGSRLSIQRNSDEIKATETPTLAVLKKMGKKRVLVSYGVDVDAIAGWLGSYKGEDSSSDISRGYFAGTVGVRRLLKLFEKYKITATWFIPGHSLESFPEECAMIRDAGHEIGLHGYSHENPVAMTFEQQRDILDHTYKLLTDFCGKSPRGTVAPWWEVSREMVELLLSYGVEYDHSMSHEDCQPYYLRIGDDWTPIDYEKKAHEWMHPFKKGKDSGLVEICANWYLDDLPPMMYMKKVPNSHGWVSARDVEDLWRVCAVLVPDALAHGCGFR